MDGDSRSTRCPNCGAPTISGELCERCAGRQSSEPRASLAPPGEQHQSGILLENKYRLLDEIGRGGMGTVFRAYDESLDRIVAVKFLLPELQTDGALVERFRREAKAMASVRHQNVLQIFSFGRHGSAYFFVMEYIDGQTAQQLIEKAQERGEFLAQRRVLKLLEQAAAGLEAVHRAGVVHRDIKPANIMVDGDTQRAVIMDFGIGKRYASGDKRRTQTPSGTPAYMAPEVVSGKEITSKEDHLSDLYAFGVTAFELLTNSLPFEADNWVDLCVKHVTEPPPTPSSRRPDLLPELDAIVLRCLSKAPQERFPTCEALRQALGALITTPSTPTPSPIPIPKRASNLPSTTPTSRRSPHQPPSPQDQQSLSSRRSSTEVTRNARLLVADPDSAFRYAVYQVAHDVFPNCRFLAAKTNAKAVQIAQESPPLLMIASLEVEGNDLNGLELAATLWGHVELENVHLVLTAERITAGERRMLEGIGVTQVMLKPVEPKELRELLLRVAHEASERMAKRRSVDRT